MDTQTVLASINDYVASFATPAALTLAEDIHLFHFSRSGDWEDEAVLFVNRNGHHFRLLRTGDGRWMYAKTWQSLIDYDDWMIQASLIRQDPLELIKLCSVGPAQGKSEALSLLPREATEGRRKAVWRAHIMAISFDRATDTFTLQHPYDASLRGTFRNKPWESRDAAKWCEQEFAGYALPWTEDAWPKPEVVVSEPDFDPEVALEGLWGSF